jgi:hypothetical protein
MSRQCKCGGVLSVHELVREREAWRCSECKRYHVQVLGEPQEDDAPQPSLFEACDGMSCKGCNEGGVCTA